MSLEKYLAKLTPEQRKAEREAEDAMAERCSAMLNGDTPVRRGGQKTAAMNRARAAESFAMLSALYAGIEDGATRKVLARELQQAWARQHPREQFPYSNSMLIDKIIPRLRKFR